MLVGRTLINIEEAECTGQRLEGKHARVPQHEAIRAGEPARWMLNHAIGDLDLTHNPSSGEILFLRQASSLCDGLV
jgi:hypothetical protein